MNLFIISSCSRQIAIGFRWEMYFRPDYRVNDYGEVIVGTTPVDLAWSRRIQVCPTQVGWATSCQRARMSSNISLGRGPAETAAPFSVNLPGLVVPTIAV